MMHPVTLNISITDANGNKYSAITTGPDAISIWDHERGDQVAEVSAWDAAVWVLTLLQSL